MAFDHMIAAIDVIGRQIECSLTMVMLYQLHVLSSEILGISRIPVRGRLQQIKAVDAARF